MNSTRGWTFIGTLAYRLGRFLLWIIARTLWHIDMQGMENLPKKGAFLLCPNHRSNADGPLTCLLTRRQMRYLAKTELFDKYENVGKLFRGMGAIPIKRGEPDRAALQSCMEALNSGRGLVLFPEGTRQEGETITDLHEGAAYLALKANVPIIPVAFGGSAGAHKKGAKFLSAAHITVIVGEPIAVDRGESKRVQRAQIDELTATLRGRMQELFDLSERRRLA